ncbi:MULTISPECIES: AI-2E family transporter [Niastella]|uniref:AI-2E family transporter n=1 Tax=Niastella soli TaxID=2821487 RepID=A0ABS3YWV0_9BACT|nr:AI-2E family transporter [Niastella soli]MBO9201880.1 AI-2E family transporter [Niastella soli]
MKEVPVTIKRSIELLGLVLIGCIIVIGKIIIMPLLMAFFISIMLLPVYRFFRKRKLPESLAVFLSILLVVIGTALIVWLFYSQISFLIYDFHKIQKNLTTHLNALSLWISRVFGFSPTEQVKFINEQSNKFLSYAANVLSGAAGSATGILIFFGLLPIYTYLLIMYRGIFMKFILMCFEPKDHGNIEDITLQIEKMGKKYLLGLLIQLCYITILLWAILAIFGIKHALLIGIMFAFLNLIPYLGALVGNILGVLITLASSESISDILFVLGAIAVVQFLDNNILMPRIVGSQVRLNPLISIIGIFIAGTMTGVSGMFLALPIIAVLKIIFDRTEQFKKWGVLLGDERPAKTKYLPGYSAKNKISL